MKLRMNPGHSYLLLAILCEVAATSALKASEQFTRWLPSVVVVVGYCAAFYLLSLCLKTVGIGVAYALWSGIGIVLIGFVTLAIYGMLFRLWPAMKDGGLAKAQFWITAIGMAGLIAGSVMQTLDGSVAVLAASSAVVIVGTLMLAWLFWERALA